MQRGTGRQEPSERVLTQTTWLELWGEVGEVENGGMG